MTTYKSDWLGFETYFYNEKTKKVSSNINDVIDYSNIEFDNDGLLNYLDFGYSVFGKTFIANVKYLLPNQELKIIDDEIVITDLEDPCLQYIENVSNEHDVLEKIREHVHQWENQSVKLVIPTSGGYDSRLLNCMVSDKSMVHAYGYGICNEQDNCTEVTYAREICNILGVTYDRIPIGDFHDYVDDWFDIFGPSVHYHGMYHLEFYNKIKTLLGNDVSVLSGIVGDLWAGNKTIPTVTSPDEVFNLGLSYSYSVDSRHTKLTRISNDCETYFESKKDLLKNSRYRMVELVRFKMMLLRYLMIVPESLGMSAASPFLDLDTAMSMLTIDPSRWENRLWQVDFFRRNGVNVEEFSEVNHTQPPNTSDLDAQNKKPLGPLNPNTLDFLMDRSIIDQINNFISSNPVAYSMMNVLLPIERIINLRNGYMND